MSKYHTWKQTYPETKVAVAQYRKTIKFNKYEMNAMVEANGYWRIYLYYGVAWPAKWSVSGWAANEEEAIDAADQALATKAQELTSYLTFLQEDAERYLAEYQPTLDAWLHENVYSHIKD